MTEQGSGAEVRTRRVRMASRTLWADGLEAAVPLTASVAAALVIADGAFVGDRAVDFVYGLGRVAGAVGAIFMLAQVLLASRAPFIERALGHDRAVAAHARWGKWAIIVMLSHGLFILGASSIYDGRTIFGQAAAYFTQAWYLALAQVAGVVFLGVLVTSLMIVRKRWRYETWHTVHLAVYAGVALAIPHQFLFGSTFSPWGKATWFWLGVYAVALGSLLTYRVIRPLWGLRRHDLKVSAVTALPDGSLSIIMYGKRLGKLAPRAGQFFLWRFLEPGLWREAHPFSLSRQPDGHSLRITVKPSGDFAQGLHRLQPGSRVMVEGPLGVFTQQVRVGGGLVLVAAGIGITPVRALLEEYSPEDGPCDVIVRMRSEMEAPLVDEVLVLAALRGATVHVVLGPRIHSGWASQAQPVTLAQLVPDIADRDVYICGPHEWADAVQADAQSAGVAPVAVHRERFGW